MKHLSAVILAAALLPASLSAQIPAVSGQRQPEIKALSAEAVQQYLAGAGMGYAKAAELNRFPGPAHVLELADKLGLTAEQHAVVSRLLEVHKAEVRYLGARLVQAERALDALFRSGGVGEYTLAEAVRSAAALAGANTACRISTRIAARARCSASSKSCATASCGATERSPSRTTCIAIEVALSSAD